MVSLLSGLGIILLIVWLVEVFLLHKGGLVHVVLIISGFCLLFQFLQYLRTKEYERER